jgi:hypothetical protein
MKKESAITSTSNRKKEPNNPYLDKSTHNFLKAAIKEGTHNIKPKYIYDYDWARNKNILAVFAGTDISIAEIANRYQITRQRGQQIIASTFNNLWANCSYKTKFEFPKSILNIKKPQTKRNRNRYLKPGSTNFIVWHDLELGKSVDEIKINNNLSSEKLSGALSRLRGRDFEVPRLSERHVHAQGLIKKLEGADDNGQIQKIFDKITDSTHYTLRRKNIIIPISKIGNNLHYHGRKTNILAQSLKENGIPVGIVTTIVKSGKYKDTVQRYYFIASKDKSRAKSVLENDPSLSAFFENPVKQIAGPFSDHIPNTAQIQKRQEFVGLRKILAELDISYYSISKLKSSNIFDDNCPAPIFKLKKHGCFFEAKNEEILKSYLYNRNQQLMNQLPSQNSQRI